MDETREALRRGIGDFAPQPDGYERVVRRLERKQRHRRVAALVVAIAIVLTGTALFVRAMPRGMEPANPSPTAALASNGPIVYSATIGPAGRGTDGDTPGDVYLVAPGEQPRRILESIGPPISRVCPSISPDGTRLAYVAGRAATTDRSPSSGTLMVVGVDLAGTPVGSPFEVEDGLDRLSRCPVWSPDGKRIAMIRGGDEVMVATLGPGSRVTDLHGFSLGGPSTFPDTPDVPAFAWSPDGAAIAAIHGGSLWVMRPDGQAHASILHRMNGTDEAVELAWSPDGTRLAVADSNGEQCCSDGPATLMIVDATTGTSTPVSLASLPKGLNRGLYGLAWLHDRDRIAITFGQGFAVVDPDGDLTPVSLQDRVITNVAWSPDEQRFVYTALGGPGYAVVSQPIDGSAPDVLTPWGGDVEWADGYAWARAGG